MSFPTSEPLLPEDDAALPPARSRRRRRSILVEDGGDRADFLQELARRAIPSADFFFFSLLTGVVLGFALLFDSQALFVLAALIAPFMAPVMGLSLATVAGSLRFILQCAGSLGMGSLLVFASGAIAGWLVPLINQTPLRQAPFHARFTLPDFIVLTLGAALATFLMVRKANHKPLAASIAVAYELYLPIGVAGFGLTSASEGLLTGGLIVFTAHLAWAALVGAVVLAVLGFKPFSALGYALAVLLAVAGLGALLTAGGIASRQMAALSLQPATPTATLASSTPGSALLPSPTITFTPTNTIVPSPTPTATLSPEPTPVWARIKPNEYGGAIIRAEPNYDALAVKTVGSDHLVEVLSETAMTGPTLWVRIRTTDGVEGWIVRALLATATPAVDQ